MTRSLLCRLAACLATGMAAALLGPVTSPTPSTAQEGDPPLEVSIDTMSPSVIPQRGPITVSGRITNRSDETWTDLNTYLVTSQEPFTTDDELAAAAETDPSLEIGGRLVDPGLYDEVGDLAPGDSTGYELTVPRGKLQISGEAGVYWIGVHVLGAIDGVRAEGADGRARSFIPLMREDGPSATLSLAVPLKAPVTRRVDGSLGSLRRWQRLLGPDGRLGRLVDLGETSVDVPLTWVLDPAVLDAATSVAGDNPPMSSGPTDIDEEGNTPPDGESPSPASPLTEEPEEGEEEPPVLSAEAEEAQRWLDQFRATAEQHPVLAVPYGDIDAAAVLRADSTAVFEQALALSRFTTESFGLDAEPVLAPPSGHLPNRVLSELDPGLPVILADGAAPEATGSVLETPGGHSIVLTDTAAGSGGPGPTPPFEALSVRQRLLSEAAVHALSGSSDEPLVVTTPPTWDPGPNWRLAEFFGGLNVPWLRTVDLPTARALGTTLREADEYDAPLAYPRQEARQELPLANVLATEEMVGVGNVYADLLSENDVVDEFLAKSGMLASSYRARTHPHRAVVRARKTTQTIRARMEQITIDGPPFVTMSSEQGTLQVTVVNGLQEPVTVGIEAIVGSSNDQDSLVIEPPEPISLGPGQRASVRLQARATGTGVYSVTLIPTSPSGEPLGSATEFAVRSSQVGLVIWVIVGIGAVVLFTASGVRIYRRIRDRGTTDIPALQDEAG